MRFHLVAAIAVLTIGATHASALYADVNADFSVTNGNPNGGWSYGYSEGISGAFNVHTNITNDGVYEAWYTAGVDWANIFRDVSGGNIGSLALHPGAPNRYSIARYTSSEAGLVTIQGSFLAGDIGSVGTYVRVDGVNYVAVLDTFNDVNYSFTANLNVGSTVEFMVNEGAGNISFDTTPISATIESVPEPASMVVLGAAGLLAARRRRRK